MEAVDNPGMGGDLVPQAADSSTMGGNSVPEGANNSSMGGDSVPQAADNLSKEGQPVPQVVYRCKKCRRIVASQDMVVPHEQGTGQKSFRWKKRSGSLQTDEAPPECSSIFVEPMKWMEAVEEGSLGEKLLCIGCKARLGSFNWSGMQCNCGTWVTPAFQLHKSRLDECPM